MEAMASSSDIPASYITIMGVDNTCGQNFRLRSLLRFLSSPTLNVLRDGTATVKIAVTWPADVVASTGMTPTLANLIVANCTSHEALSSYFTPSIMAAFEITSTPYADIVQSNVQGKPISAFISEIGEVHVPGVFNESVL